ncbi:hypothetical protein CES86_1048 [Brucella lupini]|uniref:Uncharacterized protein n=1 Tax=Brucella lupini TaxID=255457 RepID=A0A256GWJ7_9HYPH|nr:hypothetical protein CES86_1048 [Brucella lupini]
MHRTSSIFEGASQSARLETSSRCGLRHARMRNALTGLRYQATLEERSL